MKDYRARTCPCCRQRFLPQPHNAYHQHYCSAKACQAASHRRSQRLWFWHNRDYYRKDEPSVPQRFRRQYGRPRHASRSVLRIRLYFRGRGRHRNRVRLVIGQPVSGALCDVSLKQPSALTRVVKVLGGVLQEWLGTTWRIG